VSAAWSRVRDGWSRLLDLFTSRDFALDIRIGTGLNHAAHGVIFGMGFAVRPRHG